MSYYLLVIGLAFQVAAQSGCDEEKEQLRSDTSEFGAIIRNLSTSDLKDIQFYATDFGNLNSNQSTDERNINYVKNRTSRLLRFESEGALFVYYIDLETYADRTYEIEVDSLNFNTLQMYITVE